MDIVPYDSRFYWEEVEVDMQSPSARGDALDRTRWEKRQQMYHHKHTCRVLKTLLSERKPQANLICYLLPFIENAETSQCFADGL